MSSREGERRLAVLGSPIAHSRSPRLHTAAYRVLGLKWKYEAEEVDAGKLQRFIASRDDSWLGLSLTMPLKHHVLPLLSTRDELSMLTGAANTILFARDAEGKRLIEGYNTDVAGIARSLADAGLYRVDRVAILGAGATAASAIVASAQLGARQVDVFARSPERAEPLRAVARSAGLTVSIRPLSSVSAGAQDASLTVCTLPGGAAPVELLAASTLPSTSALLDVAYDPWPSPLATLWARAERPVVSGLAMLVHQALVQIRIFVGGDPEIPLDDESAVRAAMFAAAANPADE